MQTLDAIPHERVTFSPRPNGAATGEAAPKEGKFRLESLATVRPVLTGRWLIKGLLPSTGLAVVYGPSGSGKSFLVTDAMMHVAMGKPWGSRRVAQTGVIYVCAEGQDDFANRIVALRDKLNAPPNTPFAIIRVAPDLGKQDGDAAELIRAIRTQAPALGIRRPGVVVLDTLARSTVGMDENSSRDMGIFVENAGKVAAGIGGLTLCVHHTGKSTTSGMRGSSALHGAADAEWSIDREGAVRTAEVVKMKSGEDGVAWSFGLLSATVGTDEDGDPVTTCTVDILTEPKHAESSGGARRKEPTGQQAHMMKAIRLAIGEAGEPMPPMGIEPAGVRGVKRRLLADYAEKLGFINATSDDSRRTQRNLILTTMAGNGFIGVSKEWIWLP
jgi:hypothetical protein